MIEYNRLSDFLPYLLSITSNAVSARIAAEYHDKVDLKVPEWRVMAVLGDAGVLTQRDLTRLTVMDKVAVNRACKVLEERGLAARKPNDEDGRSHLLELTESGQAMHDDIMPIAQEMEKRLFANFTDEECENFRHMLARVREEVQDLDMDGLFGDDFGVR